MPLALALLPCLAWRSSHRSAPSTRPPAAVKSLFADVTSIKNKVFQERQERAAAAAAPPATLSVLQSLDPETREQACCWAACLQRVDYGSIASRCRVFLQPTRICSKIGGVCLCSTRLTRSVLAL